MTEAASNNSASDDQASNSISQEKLREIQREADRCAYNGGRALNAVFYSDMNSPERLVMLFLGSEMNFNGDFAEFIAVSRKKMMLRLGFKDHKTLDRHIGTLEERGYLTVVRKQDHRGVWDPEGNEYSITKKFFDDYSDWLARQAVDHGISPKTASYKRNSRYAELGSGKNSPRGQGKIPLGVGENFPPFYSSSSPSELNSKSPNTNAGDPAKEAEPKKKQKPKKEKPEKDPDMPTRGSPENREAVKDMVLEGKKLGLTIKPDALALTVDNCIQKLGTSIAVIREVWPLAIVGMMEKGNVRPAAAFFNWMRFELKMRQTQSQYDQRHGNKGLGKKEGYRYKPSGPVYQASPESIRESQNIDEDAVLADIERQLKEKSAKR